MSLASIYSPRWNEVTALFGGRFDPPHLGHREAARGLLTYPGVKQVWVLPTAIPLYKNVQAQADDRAAMVKLNFSSFPKSPYPPEITLYLGELERARHNPKQPSYTFDTLQEIKKTHAHLAFVVGSDQLEQLHTWYRFPDLLTQCHWIVLERKPTGKETALRTLQEWQNSRLIQQSSSRSWQILRTPLSLTLVPTEATSASSTEIRETLSRTGAPPPNSLLPEVLAYLKEKRLYGM